MLTDDDVQYRYGMREEGQESGPTATAFPLSRVLCHLGGAMLTHLPVPNIVQVPGTCTVLPQQLLGRLGSGAVSTFRI
jgi:hypothetical protein